MKAIFASFALALAPMLAPTVQPAPAKTSATNAVVVSLNRLAAESAEGKAANQRLQQLAQKMAADINAKRKEGTASQEELQKMQAQAQNDFNNNQRQLQTEIRTKLNPLLQEVAAKHGADLILNVDGAVVWVASPAFDITNEVLAKLNAPAPAPK